MAVVEVLPWAPVTATWVWPSIEPGQHLAPAQHGKPPGPGRGQFGVVFFDRGGVDHDAGVAQVFGPVAQVDAHPQSPPAAE